jgi:hypothetical protein
MTATSGLLYVASKLTIPARISVEEYDTWYNDIHIPHILETSEIDSAYRYYATTTPDSTPEWSFLAVYPVASINFFETEEFNNIPLTSATLPGPSHSCLDIAEFDNRRYRELGKWEDKEMPASKNHAGGSVETVFGKGCLTLSRPHVSPSSLGI